LNSDISILEFVLSVSSAKSGDRSTYKIPSGETRYFSHSTSHSASLIGGNIPVKGSHSVILNPDSVNLVKPPMTTIPNTSAEHPNNQLGSERGIAADVVGVDAVEAEADDWTGCTYGVDSKAAVVKRRNEGEKNVVVRADG
jgi:hypothetical protein